MQEYNEMLKKKYFKEWLYERKRKNG
jgi:hypothetical protein